MGNRKVLLIADFMEEAGLRLLRSRDDLELVMYPPSIKPAEFHPLLRDASGVALGSTPFRRADIEASPKLEVVGRIGVGFDSVEVPALTERRIPLMVVGSANATSVAEHAVFMMLAIAKRALDLDRRMRDGTGHNRARDPLPREVAGATVLVIGFGRIGTRTAPRCAAFGMNVLVYDPYVQQDVVAGAGYEWVPDLDAALGRADYVTIHCPRNSETLGLFGATRLARMKPGAVLVNTARGGIVDEVALQQALEAGHLSGAGLDVLEQEPAKVDHPLLQLPNVISSPHLAGVTVEAMSAMAVATARNLLSVVDKSPIRENVINPEVLVP